MPVNPEIMLTKPPAPPQLNPVTAIETLQGFMSLQGSMNQLKVFQRDFAARQKAGQIIANAPDLESALKTMMQDADVAPNAVEIINQYRQMQNTMADIDLKQTETSGKKQEVFNSALEHSMKLVMPNLFANPTPKTWENGIAGALAGVSPLVKDDVAKALGSFGAVLTDDLPPERAAAKAALSNRLAPFILGSGFSAEAFDKLVATNELLDLGSGIQPGVREPAYKGGGFTPSGPFIPKPAAEHVITGPFGPGGAETAVTVGGGNPFAPKGAAGGRGAPLGLSVASKNFLEDQGKAANTYIDNLNQRVNVGGQVMYRFKNLIPLLDKAYTGGLSSVRTELATAAQGIGASPEIISKIQGGSDNDALAAAQLLQKAFVRNSADQLTQTLGGNTSQVTDRKWEVFMNANPNLDTDPQAIRKMLQAVVDIYNIDKTEQQLFNAERKKSGFDVLEWPQKWQEEAIKRGFWSNAPLGEESAGLKPKTTKATGNALTPRPPIGSFAK